jgi:uncharacterized protein (DUF885 family)
LHQLLKEEWQYELKSAPETATALGDNQYNAELTDYSPEGFRHRAEQSRAFLRQFEQLDSSTLSAQDRLNRTLMIRQLRESIESYSLNDWQMPVDQMNGIHLQLASLPGNTQFASVKDYDDYVSRLKKLPAAFEQIETDMKLGSANHLFPPRYLVEKAADQAQQIAESPEDKNPFAVPVQKFAPGIAEADQTRIRSAVLDALKNQVVPCYRQFGRFVRQDYAPLARTEPGVWSLPSGERRYRRAVREMTTTDLSPDAFHAIGLKQVGEIEAEMLTLAQHQGFRDLKSFNASIKAEKKFYATSGQQILSLYAGYIGQMKAEMPKLFEKQPRVPVDVVPMEEFRAKDAVPADYSPGSADGKRHGRVNVNEWDPQHRLTLNIEAIAYHEGIPGHHQQIGLAQELSSLPEFRRNAGYNAFVEGWALYSERLGKEVGFYKDPYSEYGRLENEMWRAVRLVVDTGVHYKHWTRQQMVDFFHAHTAMDEPNIQTEVDRYIAWPGQALAYKAGQIKILELREKARREMGSRFDLKAFHNAVLRNGALPLDVLENEVNAWMKDSK